MINMDRKTKLIFNTASGILYQFVTIICGFILPHYFLSHFGSEVNGLVSSITNFLGFISLCECGVGAVVQSELYKPLAEHDEDLVSKIIVSSERFFRTVAVILVGYVIILAIIYPQIVNEAFDFWFTSSLILVISISSFAQYYFSVTYRLLLNADQKGYIQLLLQTITLILNTFFCIVLMNLGASIQVVKLATSLIFVLQPIVLNIYVKKHYKLNKRINLTEEPLKQKWNGLAQHIAAVVLGNTGTVVLTLLSTLENVSIYNVYCLVVNGIKSIILSATSGIQAMLGNMYVKNEIMELSNSFSAVEWVIHTLVTLFFTITGILIVPFVKVYTLEITDANYIVPVFAVLLTIAQATYCLRLPYNMMVLAAGHYRQTQSSALIEVSINIVISTVTVLKFGLVGVAIGMLSAMLYRTIYLAWYLRENIIKRSFKYFLKHCVVDVICVFAAVVCTVWIKSDPLSYLDWIGLALIVSSIVFIVCVIVNVIAYKEMVLRMMHSAKNKIHRRKI